MRTRANALATGSAVALLLLAACDATDAYEPRSVAELRAMVARDSAAGDSAALATLPPRLQDVLRLEPFLTDEYLGATPEATCLIDGAGGDGSEMGAREVLGALASTTERRRVRTPLPDGSALVVFVRARSDAATLERVEIVRRPPGGEQRGWIWDGARDATVEARWPASLRGRVERAPQPRGGPIPRSVRALGRLVLGLSCEPARAPETEDPDAPVLSDDPANDPPGR